MANLNYSILTSTNLSSAHWTRVGSATADSTGNFQFIDTTAS